MCSTIDLLFVILMAPSCCLNVILSREAVLAKVRGRFLLFIIWN